MRTVAAVASWLHGRIDASSGAPQSRGYYLGHLFQRTETLLALRPFLEAAGDDI
jgi:hypothetical protein